jgi:hypothetical protein
MTNGTGDAIRSLDTFLPVRSLAWCGNDLILGSLTGTISRLPDFAVTDSEPLPIDDLGDTVVALRMFNEYLLAGTTKGEVALYKDFVRQWLFVAHHPAETTTSDFGSLTNYSEVWTLGFSPDGSHMVTGSEDQTVVVWKFAEDARESGPPKKVIELPKHAAAVTGVLWRTYGDSEILLTSSDDKTLRVYDTTSWTIQHTFSTMFIK